MADDLFKLRRFRLELDGMVQGAFGAMEPPGETVRVVRAEDDTFVPALPGERTHAKLFDGVANTRELFAWFNKVLAGTPDPRTVRLVEVGEDGLPLARHTFRGAWPVRLRLAALTTDQLFDVEEIELAVERWQWERAAPEEDAVPSSPPRPVR